MLKGTLTINNVSFCRGMKFFILLIVYNYNFLEESNENDTVSSFTGGRWSMVTSQISFQSFSVNISKEAIID